MKATIFTQIARMAAGAAVLVALSPACAAQNADSARVAQILMEAKGHAVVAAIDANHLHTYHMSGVPWQVHYYRLVRTGDDLKALEKDLKQLQAIRDQASPKQQAVIDEFEALLSGLRQDVSSTRKYLVRNNDEINLPSFHNQVDRHIASIERVSSALCNCVQAENNRMIAAYAKAPGAGRAAKTAGPDCPSIATR